MARGRWSFHARKTEPRLYAILKLPNGKLIKKEVKKESSHSKIYDGFIKSVSGLFIPKVVDEWNRYRDKEKLRGKLKPPT